jgi:hypothetical protein
MVFTIPKNKSQENSWDLFYLFCWLIHCQGCKQTQHQNSHTKQDDESVDYCIHTYIISPIIIQCNTRNNKFHPPHRDQI